jgi:hypothetical protein
VTHRLLQVGAQVGVHGDGHEARQVSGRRGPPRGRLRRAGARSRLLVELREENMDTQERHDVYRQFCEELGEEGFDTSAFSELV